jgi:hypothetical protein
MQIAAAKPASIAVRGGSNGGVAYAVWADASGGSRLLLFVGRTVRARSHDLEMIVSYSSILKRFRSSLGFPCASITKSLPRWSLDRNRNLWVWVLKNLKLPSF